jgi:mannitol-1-phosphate 5-dehydrogenase
MLLAQSGYAVTFIDVDSGLVAALNERGGYTVRTPAAGSIDGTNFASAAAYSTNAASGSTNAASYSTNATTDTIVENISAIDGSDTEAAAAAVAAADIMAVSVGARALPMIAPVIAEGVRRRKSTSGLPLDILICENLAGANEKLAEWLASEGGLPEHTIRESVGLVETAIARMIPVQDISANGGDPLTISAEAYAFLPVDGGAFKCGLPDIVGMIPCENFEGYVSRKLYVHNMGHAVCAYLGMLDGCKYIYDATGNGDIRYIAQSAMLESARALAAEYGLPLDSLLVHIADLIKRFSDTSLAFSCERAGADTARKLGGSDRFIGAARLCGKHGMPSAFIEAGAAGALHRHMGGASENGSEGISMTGGMTRGMTGREGQNGEASVTGSGRPIEAARLALKDMSGLTDASSIDKSILDGIMRKYQLLGSGDIGELARASALEAARLPVV